MRVLRVVVNKYNFKKWLNVYHVMVQIVQKEQTLKNVIHVVVEAQFSYYKSFKRSKATVINVQGMEQ